MNVNQKTARFAGVLYLIIFAGGIFAQFLVRQSLIVPNDTVTTANNILNAEAFFRLGIGGDLLMLLSDVALAVVFYVLLRPVNNALAMLAAVFRLTQAAVIGSSLVNLFYALNLLHSADLMTAVGAEQLMLFLNAHAIGYSVAMIFFGVNCLLTGYLVFRSGYFPRVLGILLVIAGVAYLADSFAQVLLTDYAAYKALFESVAIPLAVVGELAMALWLLIRGVNVAAHERRLRLATA
ncbi:MAG TPA: DUF4386 domain-containing protein [Caldilineaceae bacterium]|nr:DUF4386 domain-containing protein [Caldilineaceae bacterium]